MPRAWWAANPWGASTEDQLTQEQFDNEVEKDLEVMLTQEQCDEEEGGAGEAAEGEEEEDDDDDS